MCVRVILSIIESWMGERELPCLNLQPSGSAACLLCAVCDNTMALGNNRDFAVHVLLYMILV